MLSLPARPFGSSVGRSTAAIFRPVWTETACFAMSNEDSLSQDQRLFKIALDTRNFEISLYWQRSNYFLVLNTALAVGFFSVKEQGYAVTLASLGAIASALWFLVNAGSKYWEHEVIIRERKLTLDVPQFAANREHTDQYVRRSLHWNSHGELQCLFDRMVLHKPSVSFMMTILSAVFCIVWVGLLVQSSRLLFNLSWIKLGSVTLMEFAFSVLSSLTAIAVIYLLYIMSATYARWRVANAECWWLPGANTFRLVVRNITRRTNLSGIRHRAWLRRVVPASDTMSVKTFVDTELIHGERLLLPGREDHPVICFRLVIVEQNLKFVVTDKMGRPEESWPIDDEGISLMIEFSVRARTWFLFKHEITRLYSIQRLRERLLPAQGSTESQLKPLLQRADEVTVTV